MIVVAVNHLLDIVIVVAFVSDALPVADPVADVGNGTGDYQDKPSLSPDYCRSPRRTDQALSKATQWRTPVVGLTQDSRRPGSGWAAQAKALAPDALRPGPGSATGKAGGVAQGAVRPGCHSGAVATWEKWGAWRATQSGQRPAFQLPARWQPRCNVKRPACRRRRRTAGASGTCGAAADVQQLRLRREGAAGACCRLQPLGEDCEAG